jgi:hypothetical protein
MEVTLKNRNLNMHTEQKIKTETQTKHQKLCCCHLNSTENKIANDYMQMPSAWQNSLDKEQHFHHEQLKQ